ncbi:hypothetical protein AAU61_06730 [Desulfocarbo indianensis]|nr:hypothetical protein AAU61_06730 [Desulfocarbo indianensis]
MSQTSDLPPAVVNALIRRERLALVGRLLRGLVHNFSGALQTVRLPLDLLELQVMRGGDMDLKAKMGSLQQGVSRLNDELNMLAGMSQQIYRQATEVLDLCGLAREQLTFWRADMFFKHEAQVDSQLPPNAQKVEASYADIALALNLLMANALESLHQNGKSSLRLEFVDRGGQVGLRIIDEGPGPSPQMAPRMFEPFTGDKGPGHEGLGLFLAREVLNRWQGQLLWAENPPGAFELLLPRAAG